MSAHDFNLPFFVVEIDGKPLRMEQGKWIVFTSLETAQRFQEGLQAANQTVRSLGTVEDVLEYVMEHMGPADVCLDTLEETLRCEDFAQRLIARQWRDENLLQGVGLARCIRKGLKLGVSTAQRG